MAKTVMCIPCSMEFPSDAAFLKHKESNHTIPGKPLDIPGPAPSAEFVKQVEEMERRKQEKPSTVQTPAGEVKLEPPKPIILHYRFDGECKKCRTPVTTLEVDLPLGEIVENGKTETAEAHFVVAHCINCKEQLESRKVAKL